MYRYRNCSPPELVAVPSAVLKSKTISDEEELLKLTVTVTVPELSFTVSVTDTDQGGPVGSIIVLVPGAWCNL